MPIQVRGRAEAYELLLLHGLVVEEGGAAVATACRPSEVIEGQMSTRAATDPTQFLLEAILATGA
jgi:hypothetical protein